jgi:hypothetical protein
MMVILNLHLILLWSLNLNLSNPLILFPIAGALDLAGMLAAIWTLWSTISLTLGGRLLRAFRLISVGALAFVLSHMLDLLLQISGVMSAGTATFLHQGIVFIAILLFVAGITDLADDLPSSRTFRQRTSSLRLWPLTVGLLLGITGFSFILYGFSLVAEAWAFIWLNGSLILLLAVCFVLMLRARLGGTIGRSLWLAMLGLFIFGLAHPVQAWFYLNTDYAPSVLAVLHRLVVIPAFFLFAISITRLGQQLNRSHQAQALPAKKVRSSLSKV